MRRKRPLAEPGDPPAPQPHLLWADPPVDAALYPPALWIPLNRLLAAQRRLQTLGERLPGAAWEAPSAAPGWRRRDVLSHLAAHGHQHHRPLRAVLAGAPLRAWQPDQDDPTLDSDGWNARQVAQRADWPLARLLDELEANMAETLRLWAQIGDHQLLLPYGLAPNLLAGLERHAWHLDSHADQIVNGPQMLR